MVFVRPGLFLLLTPNMNHRVAGRSSMTSKRGKYKTELCIHYSSTGTCYYGAKCHYAHGREDIRVPGSAHPRYKTSLCKNELGDRKCQFGDRCMFIHRCDPQYHALKSLAERPDRSNVPTILVHHMPEKKNSESHKTTDTGDAAAAQLETSFQKLGLGPPVAPMPHLPSPNPHPLANGPMPLPNSFLGMPGMVHWNPIPGISEADRRYAAASVWGAPVSPERKGLVGKFPAEYPPLSLA